MKRLSALLLLLAACGGTQDGGPTPTGGSGGGQNNATGGDAVIDLSAKPIEVKGVMFEPEGLGRPGMPVYEPKKKLTLDNQRKAYQVQKNPVQKEAQAAILASMLYEESKKVTGDAAKALLTEARQALRDASALSGANVDEATVRLLGSYEIIFEDWAAAEKAWAAVVAKDPKSTDLAYNKAWWAFTLLKQGKNADALNIVKAETLSDKQPELAYVAAWAKWRTGDTNGALAALVTAAPGWGGTNREQFDRDVFLFAGRSASTPDQISPQLFNVFAAKAPEQQYSVLTKMGLQSYQFSGRWQDAIATLDKAVQLAGGKAPAEDMPVIRYHQADFMVRLDQPDAASRYAKQALDALAACGAKCPEKVKQDFVQGVYGIGRMFHLLYATANDIRYYQPASDLYNATVPLIMDPGRRTQAKADQDNLAQTLKNTKAGTGTHQPEAIGILLQRHNQEVQACHEAALVGNPKLAGTVTLSLESDASGEIKGASSEPKAGAADLALVAGCVVDHAKTWKLPKRGSAGNTRIKLVYQMSPRAPQ